MYKERFFFRSIRSILISYFFLIFVLIVSILLTTNYCFQVLNNFYFVPSTIPILEKKFQIPKSQIISIQTFCLDIPEPKHNLIYFFGNQSEKNKFPKNANKIIHSLNYIAYHANASLICLKNTYFSYGLIVSENFTYTHLVRKYKKFVASSNWSVINSCNIAIGFGHRYIEVFGHFFYDILSPLTMVPDNIIKNSNIIVPLASKKLVKDLLIPVFEINENQIVYIKKYMWVFCAKLYTAINPIALCNHYCKLMSILSNKIRKAFKIQNVNPTKYYFSNRPKRPRYISNFFEIFQQTQSQFPKYNLEYIDDPLSIQEIALTWANAKFIFMPGGSNFAKNLFMKENSIIVMAIGNFIEYPSALTAAAHGVFSLYCFVSGMKHKLYQPHLKIELNLVIRTCEIAFNCIENGYWKENF